jgi:hypothetical protein
MAGPVFYDMVMETSTTESTGTYTLAGAVSGHRTFSVVGDGNTCYYRAQGVDGSGVPNGGWEVGKGTYTAAGTLLARTSILSSSNGNNAMAWAAGTKRIALVSPAAMFGHYYTEVTNSGAGGDTINATTSAKITTALNTVVENPMTWWDTTNKKFLPTVGGLYRFTARANLVSLAADKEFILMLYKNGSEARRGIRMLGAGASASPGGEVNGVIRLNGSTDYVEVWMYNGDSSARDVEAVAASCRLEAQYIGP